MIAARTCRALPASKQVNWIERPGGPEPTCQQSARLARALGLAGVGLDDGARRRRARALARARARTRALVGAQVGAVIAAIHRSRRSLGDDDRDLAFALGARGALDRLSKTLGQRARDLEARLVLGDADRADLVARDVPAAA